ncbi:hypothetical protein Tco_0696827 [Tanacetum coccineum]
MRTRSSGPVVEPSTTPRRRRNKKHSQQVDPTIVEKPVVTMADTRTMADLLQAPTRVTNGCDSSFCFSSVRSSAHIRVQQEPGLVEKDPPHSIVDLGRILFPIFIKTSSISPSNNQNLRICDFDFQQRFDESFCEAWERFKDLLRACPHHGFMELHQIDTFYNSLTSTDQDSLNAAALVAILTNDPKDCLKTLIENKSKSLNFQDCGCLPNCEYEHFTSGLSPNVVALTDAVKACSLKNNPTPGLRLLRLKRVYVLVVDHTSLIPVSCHDGNA